MASVAEKVAVMTAWIEGKPLEFKPCGFDDDSYSDLTPDKGEPAFDFVHNDYRVAPPKPPSVDWSQLSDKTVAITQNEDGIVWAWVIDNRFSTFRIAPDLVNGVWFCEVKDTGFPNVRGYPLDILKSAVPGSIHWAESYVPRPEKS